MEELGDYRPTSATWTELCPPRPPHWLDEPSTLLAYRYLGTDGIRDEDRTPNHGNHTERIGHSEKQTNPRWDTYREDDSSVPANTEL